MNNNKSEGVLTMVCSGGLFIIGKLDGNIPGLTDPRTFSVIADGTKIWMSTLPGEPKFIVLKDYGFSYEISSDNFNILNLYHRVTDPQPELVEESLPKPEPVSGRVFNLPNSKLN